MVYDETPDRRPLLYGFAALLILVAAGFLFWPRGDRNEAPGMVLTPNSDAGQLASQMETPSDATESSPDRSAADTEQAPEEIRSQPITETEYALETDRGATKSSATSSSPSNSAEPQSASPRTSGGSQSVEPSRPSQDAPRSTDLSRPGPSGRYLLYLGSYSTRENAQRRATELQGKGIPTEIAQGTRGDGSAVYRVRVGYFEGHSLAKAYGENLKSRHELEYWIAER